MGATLHPYGQALPGLTPAHGASPAAHLASLGAGPQPVPAVAGGASPRPWAAPGWPPDPRKKEARPTAGTASGPSLISSDEYRNSASRSTATQAQHDRILAALASRPHNTFELRALGVMQVSARVCELRAEGHRIVTVDRVEARDAEGILHGGVALYALAGGGEDA